MGKIFNKEAFQCRWEIRGGARGPFTLGGGFVGCKERDVAEVNKIKRWTTIPKKVRLLERMSLERKIEVASLTTPTQDRAEGSMMVHFTPFFYSASKHTTK